MLIGQIFEAICKLILKDLMAGEILNAILDNCSRRTKI